MKEGLSSPPEMMTYGPISKVEACIEDSHLKRHPVGGWVKRIEQ